MKEPLDQLDALDEKVIKHSNIKVKSAIYIFTMLIGGMLYMKYLTHFPPTFQNMLYGSFVLFVAFISINGILVPLNNFIQKRRHKNTDEKKKPLWFQILEHSFTWWVITMVIIIIGTYI